MTIVKEFTSLVRQIVDDPFSNAATLAEYLLKAADMLDAESDEVFRLQCEYSNLHNKLCEYEQTRSQKLAEAGFVRRPSLRAMEMRAALELIAAPQRSDGTWNRDREACRILAAETLGRYDD